MASGNAVEKMVGAYYRYMQINAKNVASIGLGPAIDIAEKQILGLEGKLLTLTSEQVSLFVKELIKEKQNIGHYITPLFITRAIQDSYNAGYNDFVIETGDIPVQSLGYMLKGRSGADKIRIKIVGVKGLSTGFGSVNCEIISSS